MKNYKKKNKISVIVTYYNEDNNIKKTIDQLLKQSCRPGEIIFISSESTDKTFEIIEKKIKYIKNKYNIRNYKNIKSPFPSTSKNLGIQLAKYPLVAFMDCGLKFSKDWLKNKVQLLQESNAEVVLGSCKLFGFNSFDIACVANTYGLNKKNLCIPGSVMKKSIFLKVGYFDISRSFYDVIWKEKLKTSKINYIEDYENFVEYDGINYAKNISNLFNKSLVYSQDILNIKKNYQTKYYLILPLFYTFLFYYNFYFFLILLVVYLFIRIFIAKIKSYKYLSPINFYLIFKIAVTGLIIDLARVVGSYKSLLNYIGINSFLSAIFLFYIILFNTPLMNVFSYDLINHNNKFSINEAEAIVVFSGDGNINYNNETYKNRALEAVKYSKYNNIKKIFLSSGREQTIADTELLKSFLISNNTNPEMIYIFERYPNSTYQNVLMVGEELLKNNFKNIIFLTTPIHNKRSILIWKKNFPKINIFTLKNNEKIRWTFNLNEILVISYEYLAIIYNFFQGRI